MGGIAIHGSLSVTAAESNKYNYYGNTDDKLDIIQREVTLNGAYRFENGLRASAQVYAYDLAGYSAITVDFANLDYSINSNLGIRAGRNKLPQGFYNEVQDLDQIRVFASLPLSFYQRGTRALGSGYNGGAVYGNVQLGSQGGSLEYQVFGGVMNNIRAEEPFARGLTTSSSLSNGLDLKGVYGIAPIWNTPIDGLRVGYTLSYISDLESYGLVTAPAFAVGQPIITTVDVTTNVASVEYTKDKWTAVAEYKYARNGASTEIAAFGVKGQKSTSRSQNWYGQLSYQATKTLGFGVYYSYLDSDPKSLDASDDKFTTLKDTAGAVSYAITPWWIVKAEYHFLDGLSGLNVVADSNPAATDSSWNYIVLKTTLSF
jgi:hypothetical protein